MRKFRLLALATLLCGMDAAECASFTLGGTIRAGIRGGGDWELGLGPPATPYSSTEHADPYFVDNREYAFSIRYTGATNLAQLSVDTNPGLGPADVVTWNPTGGSASTNARLWTIASGGLSVVATFVNRPADQPRMPQTEIEVRSLAIQPGVDILTPLSATTLIVVQQGATVSSALAAPVVFQTRNGSGDWQITGTIRMRGLGSAVPSGAVRSELQFLFGLTAADVPEPGTLALTAAGLLIAVRRRA